MTVSELDLGTLSAEQAVEVLADAAPNLNGKPSADRTEILVEKLASLAEKDGVNVAQLKVEMGDQTGPYWKGPLAAAKQARFRELASMFDRQKAKR